MEASVARRLRTPPEGANPQDLNPSTNAALRGEGHRSIVVVGNYKVDPITAVSCRAKDRPLGPPSNLFRPRRSARPSRAWVEAPGTAPGSERLIPTPIYRHSGPRGSLAQYRDRRARWEEPAGESSSDSSVEAGRIAWRVKMYTMSSDSRRIRWTFPPPVVYANGPQSEGAGFFRTALSASSAARDARWTPSPAGAPGPEHRLRRLALPLGRRIPVRELAVIGPMELKRSHSCPSVRSRTSCGDAAGSWR